MTPLDQAHARMEASPDDDTARLVFYDRLASAELFILLDGAQEGQNITPRLFPLDGDSLVLAFDTEDRLSQFAEGPAPYAALSGRALAEMLAPSRLGLGLNLDVAPSAIILPPQVMAWLDKTLQSQAEQMTAQPLSFEPPQSLPETLLIRLDEKLSTATGLAERALLCFARYADGSAGHLLGFAGTRPGAEPALAQIAREALTFSGLESGQLDVVFLSEDDARLPRLEKIALRFDIPQPDQPPERTAPGSDPSRPPKL